MWTFNDLIFVTIIVVVVGIVIWDMKKNGE
jgi:predicted small integral membrane protein